MNALWDLAPHDVSIFNYLLGASPTGSAPWARTSSARPGRRRLRLPRLSGRRPGPRPRELGRPAEGAGVRGRRQRQAHRVQRPRRDERVRVSTRASAVPDVEPETFGESFLLSRRGDRQPGRPGTEPLKSSRCTSSPHPQRRRPPTTDARWAPTSCPCSRRSSCRCATTTSRNRGVRRHAGAEFLPFVDLAAQHRELAAELDEVLKRMLADRLDPRTRGRRVRARVRSLLRDADAIGVDSGLSALELALRAFGRRAGRRGHHAGEHVHRDGFRDHPRRRDAGAGRRRPGHRHDRRRAGRAAITSRTRAVMPVHLHGLPAEMDDPVDRRATGWSSSRTPARPTAPATAVGGPARSATPRRSASTRQEPRRGRGRRRGRHRPRGSPPPSACCATTASARSTTTWPSATTGASTRCTRRVLRVKLRHLDAWNGVRAATPPATSRIARRRRLTRRRRPDYPSPLWHLYVVRVRSRDPVRAASASSHRPGDPLPDPPCHFQAGFAGLRGRPGDFPVTEEAAREISRCRSIPSSRASSSRRSSAQSHGRSPLSGTTEIAAGR